MYLTCGTGAGAGESAETLAVSKSSILDQSPHPGYHSVERQLSLYCQGVQGSSLVTSGFQSSGSKMVPGVWLGRQPIATHWGRGPPHGSQSWCHRCLIPSQFPQSKGVSFPFSHWTSQPARQAVPPTHSPTRSATHLGEGDNDGGPSHEAGDDCGAEEVGQPPHAEQAHRSVQAAGNEGNLRGAEAGGGGGRVREEGGAERKGVRRTCCRSGVACSEHVL
jgi:hypothetical protein